MSNNKIRDLEKIKEEVKEPKYDYIEKFAKLSDDKKSLLLRVPQEIRNKLGIKAGDKLRFYAKFEHNKTPQLKIEWEKVKNVKQN